MGLNVGGSGVTGVYVGGDAASAVCLGGKLVWEPSSKLYYALITSDGTLMFCASRTEIAVGDTIKGVDGDSVTVETVYDPYADQNSWGVRSDYTSNEWSNRSSYVPFKGITRALSTIWFRDPIPIMPLNDSGYALTGLAITNGSGGSQAITRIVGMEQQPWEKVDFTHLTSSFTAELTSVSPLAPAVTHVIWPNLNISADASASMDAPDIFGANVIWMSISSGTASSFKTWPSGIRDLSQVNLELSSFRFSSLPPDTTVLRTNCLKNYRGISYIDFKNSRIEEVESYAFNLTNPRTSYSTYSAFSISFPATLRKLNAYIAGSLTSAGYGGFSRYVWFAGTPDYIDPKAFTAQYTGKFNYPKAVYVPWSEGEVTNAPWGLPSQTAIRYDGAMSPPSTSSIYETKTNTLVFATVDDPRINMTSAERDKFGIEYASYSTYTVLTNKSSSTSYSEKLYSEMPLWSYLSNASNQVTVRFDGHVDPVLNTCMSSSAMFYRAVAITRIDTLAKFHLPTIPASFCYGCTNLESIGGFSPYMTSIGASAFDGCAKLSVPPFPASLQTIGDAAFRGCTSAKALTFLGTPTSISATAFSGCTNIKDIYVPWSEGAVANAPWGATAATVHYDWAG